MSIFFMAIGKVIVHPGQSTEQDKSGEEDREVVSDFVAQTGTEVAYKQ